MQFLLLLLWQASQRPILVHTANEEDAATCLVHAARVANMAEEVYFVPMGHNNTADIDQMVLSAMMAGAWLVLLHAHTEVPTLNPKP